MAGMPDMGKMLGPLPLGAWIVVVGGGLGIAYYTHQNNTPNEPAIVEDTSGTPGVGDGGSGMYWQDASPPDNAGGVAGAPTDNDQWGRLATNYLIAQGYPPSVADSAIRKYLAGDKLSAQEFSLVNVALRQFGSPPIPLPPPVFGPPKQPKPKPKPEPKPRPKPKSKPKPKPKEHKPVVKKPHNRYYTVRRGDTLWDIARRFYHNPNEWRRIYNANKGHGHNDIRNPNLIYPGQRFNIPR